MDKKIIVPGDWTEYLADFSSRNSGRRARFEVFANGRVAEEDEEAVFDQILADGDIVTVKRINNAEGQNIPLSAEVPGVRGIAVQADSDGSDNTIEFMNGNGDLTVLHFESLVDGSS